MSWRVKIDRNLYLPAGSIKPKYIHAKQMLAGWNYCLAKEVFVRRSIFMSAFKECSIGLHFSHLIFGRAEQGMMGFVLFLWSIKYTMSDTYQAKFGAVRTWWFLQLSDFNDQYYFTGKGYFYWYKVRAKSDSIYSRE